MRGRTRWIAGSAVLAALLGIGAGIALAAGAREHETPITGPALDKAAAAAIAHTGGGRITETEVGDEEGLYEVEVTLQDGSQVDVHLDRDFNVIGHAADGENDGKD